MDLCNSSKWKTGNCPENITQISCLFFTSLTMTYFIDISLLSLQGQGHIFLKHCLVHTCKERKHKHTLQRLCPKAIEIKYFHFQGFILPVRLCYCCKVFQNNAWPSNAMLHSGATAYADNCLLPNLYCWTTVFLCFPRRLAILSQRLNKHITKSSWSVETELANIKPIREFLPCMVWFAAFSKHLPSD